VAGSKSPGGGEKGHPGKEDKETDTMRKWVGGPERRINPDQVRKGEPQRDLKVQGENCSVVGKRRGR